MVYVDTIGYPYGRMIMFHLLADTLEELHDMVDKIGVNRKWFQNKEGYPHYDICKSKKALAIKYGATEMRDREILQQVKGKYPKTPLIEWMEKE